MYIENIANKEKLSEGLDLLEDLRKKVSCRQTSFARFSTLYKAAISRWM